MQAKNLRSSVKALTVSVLTGLLFLCYQPALGQVIIPRPPDIAATSYLLIDAKTGHVIVEENADEPLPPASLTKIMTAYIAIEEVFGGNLALTDEVHISEKAWRMEGSRMFVDVNTVVTVEDLLRGIIIQSGNDASVAIAEHIAGSEEAFADMMNQHAEVLGMDSSFFMNASGLDTETDYNTMSARDLATIAQATIARQADFYSIYAEREFTYNGISQSNRNTLLFRDRNVDGLKTGWTDAAGYCLVASAERNGMRLISVVMGTDSESARATETQKLMSYGFRYYETHKLYEADQILVARNVYGGVLDQVELGVESEAFITIPRGQAGSMAAVVELSQLIEAPVADRQPMGIVTVSLDEDLLYSTEVVAMHAVEKGNVVKQFTDWVKLMLQGAG